MHLIANIFWLLKRNERYIKTTMTGIMKFFEGGFKFSENDLLANRQGKLTQQQKAALKEKAKSSLILSAVVCLVAGLIILWIVGTYYRTVGAYDLVMRILTGIFFFGLVVLLLSLLLFTLPGYRNWKEDIDTGRVDRICGRVSLDVEYRSGRYGYTLFKLAIGSQTFQLSKDAFLAFENGQNYCLYYAPKTKAILSVEKVPSSMCSAPSQSLPA
jgi:hypothetical protein